LRTGHVVDGGVALLAGCHIKQGKCIHRAKHVRVILRTRSLRRCNHCKADDESRCNVKIIANTRAAG
jgi:hypothetical protein